MAEEVIPNTKPVNAGSVYGGIHRTSGRPVAVLTDSPDYLEPSDNDDQVDARGGDDYLSMGGGNDVAFGGEGNDTLDGGTGNDMLRGDAGLDVFVLRRGSGIDIVDATDTSDFPLDQLRFEDVRFADLKAVLRSGDDLILQYGDADQVTVVNHFSGNASGLGFVIFSDRTVYLDTLFTHYPIRLIDGDDSADFLLNQNEAVLAGDGNDLVRSYGGNDTVDGEAGDDDLRGGDGDDSLAGGTGADSLQGGNDNDTLLGGEGNDRLEGNDGNDALHGGLGHDTLDGGAGNDTLDGGSGNDSLVGGEGDDLFVLHSGSGADRINLHDTATARMDVIRFEEVAMASVTAATREGADLTLHYGDGDSVTFESYYAGDAYRFSWLEFSDGSQAPRSLMRQFAVALTGQDDDMSFTADDEHILGGAGNDKIAALDGDDTLSGEAGNDSLDGGAGNDVLIGGSGNDSLTGGAGNDLFLVRAGSGADRIDLYDTDADALDIVRFEDVARTDLTGLSREGADLTVHFGAGDSVTFESYYAGEAYRFSWLEFADVNGGYEPGSLWHLGAVSLSDQDDNVSFTDYDEHIFGGAGNDVLDGGAGDDTIDGGADNDFYVAGAGNDTYLLRVGSGVDVIESAHAVPDQVKALVFEDVASTELTGLQRIGTDLVLSYGNNDQVTLQDQFGDGAGAATAIRFTDVWQFTTADLLATYDLALTDGADTVSFDGGGTEKIRAGAGDDVVATGGGYDQIYGDAGNDNLAGGAGDDTLAGGTGADTLVGGSGYDTYLVLAGDGKDTIDVISGAAGEQDIVRFDDLVFSQLGSVTRNGDDLVIAYGADDQLTLTGVLAPGQDAACYVQFADWAMYSVADLIGVAAAA